MNENKEDKIEIKNDSVGYELLNPWWDFPGIDTPVTWNKKDRRKGRSESLKCGGYWEWEIICHRVWYKNVYLSHGRKKRQQRPEAIGNGRKKFTCND